MQSEEMEVNVRLKSRTIIIELDSWPITHTLGIIGNETFNLVLTPLTLTWPLSQI